jgi:hypothetical protein
MYIYTHIYVYVCMYTYMCMYVYGLVCVRRHHVHEEAFPEPG